MSAHTRYAVRHLGETCSLREWLVSRNGHRTTLYERVKKRLYRIYKDAEDEVIILDSNNPLINPVKRNRKKRGDSGLSIRKLMSINKLIIKPTDSVNDMIKIVFESVIEQLLVSNNCLVSPYGLFHAKQDVEGEIKVYFYPSEHFKERMQLW